MDNIKIWYSNNLQKILLLLTIIVTFTLAVVYIPYLNIIFSSLVALFIIIFTWYLIFPPSNYVLTVFSIFLLFSSLITSELQLTVISEILGEGIYVFLIFLLINFFKEIDR